MNTPLKSLPESFWFGVAVADHQCEAYREDCPDIQDQWEAQRRLVHRQQATDFWNRYLEDIRLSQEMGCKVFRFSLAWSRLEPNPGQYDEAAFAHYRQVLEAIRSAGMEPLVTLHHYSWPLHVEARGGSIAVDFPDLFASYVEQVVSRLGDMIHYWITFNEPNQLIFGYFKAGDYHLPPGNPPGTSVDEQMAKVQRLIPNLFIAHAKARTVIKSKFPNAKVGANPFLLGLPKWSRQFVDWQATRLKEKDWVKQGYRYTEQSFPWPRDADLVVAMLTVTPERAEQVNFSEVYFIDQLRLLVHFNSQVHQSAQLAGQRVAVVTGTTAASALPTAIPQAIPHPVPSLADALPALESGTVAAILADEVLLRGAIAQTPDRYRLLEESLQPVQPYAVGVTKGNPRLLEAVDLAVRKFREQGYLSQSAQSHLPHLDEISASVFQVRQRVPISFNGEAAFDPTPFRNPELGVWLQKIHKRGYLLAAVRDDVPGMGYRDPQTGEYQGLEIDLARQIAEVILGDRNKVKFKPVKVQKRLSVVSSVFQCLDPLLQSISILSSILNSNWWNLGMAGKLPTFLCPEGCAYQQDFVGLDYYWGTRGFQPKRLIQLSKSSQGNYTQAPVWPEGLYYLLKQHAEWFPDQEIIVVENGCVVEADGISRIDYIRQHVAQLIRAHAEGIKVKAYLCWSITSNREWGFAFGPNSDFGLYHIDLDNDPNLTRMPTEGVAGYKALIQASVASS